MDDLKLVIKQLEKRIKTLELENKDLKLYKKGRQCSDSGAQYELKIFNIVSNCHINGIKFNKQNKKDIGGSSSRIDLICNYKDKFDVGIEIKKKYSPDWIQCGIKYNTELKIWHVSKKTILPRKCVKIFNHILSNEEINNKIYNGNVPPFINKKLTYEEWTNIKQRDQTWNDIYFDIPNDTIKNLYKRKGCSYIQISDHGLYHLGNDKCGFGVPEFIIDQQIRVRIKVHHRKNKNKYCSLSITMACQPKKINDLVKSNYSLDNISKLPNKLKYSQ